MRTLLILASGKGSRLYDVHQNVYPKLLVNFGPTTFMQACITKYESVFDEIKIVVNSKDIKACQQILNTFTHACKVTFTAFDECIGTYKTLQRVLRNHTGSIYVSWSDILLLDHVDVLKTYDRNVIFTDVQRRHRLGVNATNDIVAYDDHTGNIPGLYFIHDTKSTFDDKYQYYTNIDLVEHFAKSNVTFETKECEFVDIGDNAKYTYFLSTLKIRSRYFNDVLIDDDTVTKTATCEHGINIMRNELAFYDANINANVMPQILHREHSTFTMTRIKAPTVHEYLLDKDIQCKNMYLAKRMLATFESSIQQIHDTPANIGKIDRNDVVKEYFTVTKERLEKIDALMPFSIDHISETLDIIANFIRTHTPKFVMLHGDPNTSNCLYDEANDAMYFIDPRGYFGDSVLIGDKYYDIAKFVYGLTGYDAFNLSTDIRFKNVAHTVQYDNPRGYDIDQLTDDNVIKFIVGIIWTKLPYYTINNINKAIVAYAHGSSMIRKYGKLLNIL